MKRMNKVNKGCQRGLPGLTLMAVLALSSVVQAHTVGPTTINQLSLNEITDTVTLTIAEPFTACGSGTSVDIAFAYDEATLSASYYALLMTAQSVDLPVTITYEYTVGVCQLTAVEVAH